MFVCFLCCVKVLSALVASIVRAAQGLQGLTWIDRVPNQQHRYTISHTQGSSIKQEIGASRRR